MTQSDKDKKLQALKDEAKDLQARLGFLGLQRDNAAKEIERIKTILEYQEAQFNAASQAPVDAE